MLLTLAFIGAFAATGSIDPSALMREESARAYVEYEHCVSMKAAVSDTFGKVHDAAPRDVATAVEPESEPQWRRLRHVVFSGLAPSDADIAQLEDLRSMAVNSAAAEVVESRIGNCGSAPGPYQCRSHRRP